MVEIRGNYFDSCIFNNGEWDTSDILPGLLVVQLMNQLGRFKLTEDKIREFSLASIKLPGGHYDNNRRIR